MNNLLRQFWGRNKEKVLLAAIIAMSFVALLKLSDEFIRLVWDQSYNSAIDLRFFQRRVLEWFAGNPVYGKLRSSLPPASYVILWPFTGWLSLDAARILWAAIIGVVLVVLCHLAVRESLATNRLERIFVTLMPLSMNATGVTIGNGQLTLHLLLLLTAIAIRLRQTPTWPRDAVTAALFVIALVKPNVAAPFFLILLFVPPTIRLACLVVVGYIALSMFAAAFQPVGLPTLIREWLARSSEWSVYQGYANAHSWLGSLHLDRWIQLASVTILVVLAIWIYVNRRADIWLLLGVTGVLARLWSYHNMYDDALILFPMIALFRIAKSQDSLFAGSLLAFTIFFMMLPARMIDFSSPGNYLFTVGHPIIWFVDLFFIGHFSWKQNRGASSESEAS